MSASTLRSFRQLHLYFGVFISPALLFFAFTGALQTFSLHETTQGSSYKPAKWIMALGQLHKKQTLVVPQRRPRPDTAPAQSVSAPGGLGAQSGEQGGKHHEHGATLSEAPLASASVAGQVPAAPAPGSTASTNATPKQKSHLPMKIFFLIVAVGLFTSTFTGIYMAYKFNNNKWVITGLLAAGVLLPLALLPF